MDRKKTGAFYTPGYLAAFLVDRGLLQFADRQNINVLEPSVGDGSFIRAIATNRFKDKVARLTAVDINRKELEKAQALWKGSCSSFVRSNFLSYETEEKFSLICGNPPYIKKSLLSLAQLKKCQKIHESEKLSDLSVKNIWTSFLVKATSMLKDDGVLAFVLPAEFLQVRFAVELRSFLQRLFERIEIFTFSDLIFEGKLQDTIAVIGFKKHISAGVFYTSIQTETQLLKNDFLLEENQALVKSDLKWSHHILNTDEIELIERIRTNLKSVGFYCETRPGVVTAANDYFIIDQTTEKKYGLNKFTESILPRGYHVNGSVVFENGDFEELIVKGVRTRLIKLPDECREKFAAKIQEYLDLGVISEIDQRYKCKLRDNWFSIPNVSSPPEGFFFKRSYHYPKVLKNTARVLVTDAAYKIAMGQGYDINSLIFSFYNSVTLTFAELDGRYYGGGVLELTPKEFRGLPLPYKKITAKEFNVFRKNFENKESIDQLLRSNDKLVPHGLSQDEIGKLGIIRKKLINKRMRLAE